MIGLRFSLATLPVLLILVLLTNAASGEPQEQRFVLGRGPERLTLNANGSLVSWAGRIAERANATAGAGEIRYDGKVLALAGPANTEEKPNGRAFVYRWPEEPGLEVSITHRLTHQNRAWTWTREVQIASQSSLTSDLTVFLESGLETLPADTWLPLINGVGALLGANQAAAYRAAGALPNPGERLALPMISVPHGQKARRLTIATDPYFSALFTQSQIGWTYPARPGLEAGSEKRTIAISSHEGGPEQSLDCFFRTILADVPPGPKWLHDIALVDYDYMSDGGQGWFRDIDALSAALPKADRHKVLLCLHGWYDFLGRYCFDDTTGKFDSEWTVFSSFDPAKSTPAFGNIGGDRVEVGFANCKPVKMSLKEVHARLNYARSRGFRVGIYFADGMNSGAGLPHFDPARVLHYGGWQGSDSKGRSYMQNPLHPKVRAFYLDYTKAMLKEFGPDIDMLNWDETFHIPAGQLGSDGAPGYADRATMQLTHDITRLVEDYDQARHRQIAFLTSDCLGAVYDPKDHVPYALMAQGTYQDSWCQPQAWSYGIFPNYRNVLWSCCWWPVTKWSWVDFGVRNYQAAVSLSNGWGNDKGFSEMTEAQRARAIALFHWRKQKPTKLKWFDQLPVYQNASQ